MTENVYDLVVVGGGPGGYVAAISRSSIRNEDGGS